MVLIIGIRTKMRNLVLILTFWSLYSENCCLNNKLKVNRDFILLKVGFGTLFTTGVIIKVSFHLIKSNYISAFSSALVNNARIN